METTNNKDRKQRRKPGVDLSTMVYGKVPPQARELEEVVLGGCLLERGAFEIAAEILRPECFYTDAHQLIFRACMELSQRSLPIDMLTVVNQLRIFEELDLVGGPYYITKLTNNVVSSANIEYHCRIIQQKFIGRELIRISGEIINDAYEDSTDIFDLLNSAEEAIYTVVNSNFKSDFKAVGTAVDPMLARIEHLKQQDTNITGVPSLFNNLDRITHGWQPTDLIILAARPSVGKTSLALTLAKNAAVNNFKPTPVGFFSLEMSLKQLVERIASADSGIQLSNFYNGRIYDMERLHKTAANIHNMPIYVDDTGALTMFELRSKARRMVAKYKVGLIIIDYLQLMTGAKERNGNREQEISGISRGLKGLAKELNIPIIALSQMSRVVETRKGYKDPMLSDLRESGAIEQDADMVMFIYKPNDSSIAENAELEFTRMLKIAKHRNGALDKLAFAIDNSVQTWNELGLLNATPGLARIPPQVQATDTHYVQRGDRLNTSDDQTTDEMPF